jgi:predicted transcriptional regulator
MSGKHMSPMQRDKAIAMRAAGYTLAVIAQETGLSVRTLSRHLAHKTKHRPITAELVQRARRALVAAVSDSEVVKEALAACVLDDLAIARAIREKVMLALDALDVTDNGSARDASRALAQLAAAAKATQAINRAAFGQDQYEQPAQPTVLEIREMTAEEVDAVVKEQKRLYSGRFDDADD